MTDDASPNETWIRLWANADTSASEFLLACADEMKAQREEIARLKGKVQELEQRLSWRRVSDELPKNGELVLIWDAQVPGYCIADTEYGGPFECAHGKHPPVSHWMPLPPIPDSDKEEA